MCFLYPGSKAYNLYTGGVKYFFVIQDQSSPGVI